MMTVSFGGASYSCTKAVRSGERAALYCEDGGKVELVGVSDFSAISIEGGDWTTEEPTESESVWDELDAAYREGVNSI